MQSAPVLAGSYLVGWENERLAGRGLTSEEYYGNCAELVAQVRDGIRRVEGIGT
jgi:hypothetical protein